MFVAAWCRKILVKCCFCGREFETSARRRKHCYDDKCEKRFADEEKARRKAYGDWYRNAQRNKSK